MRTKSFLFSMLAVAGMLFVSSCAQDDALEGAADANYIDATFTLTTADAAGTRATVGNGTKADKVVCGVFDKYGVEMNLRQTIDVEGKKATYKTRLAKGQDYRVVFFAYNEAAAAYDVTDLKNIKVKGDQLSNVENRDAFTAYIDIKADETLNSITKPVDLRRPFAQLNLGINQAEYDAAEAAGIVVAKTEIKVSNVYSNFSAYDNAVAADAKEGTLTFKMNAIPDEKLEVDLNGNGTIEEDEKFHYLALNYLLVGDVETEKKLTDVKFRWENKSDATAADYKTNSPVTEFINIPVQRNYRTNIIGSLLTSPATFNIVIDERFDGEYPNDDNNSFMDELLLAATVGGEVTLSEDITLTEPLEVNGDMVINMAGKTITGSINLADGANLTVENGAIANTNENVSGIISNGNLTLNNVEIESARHALRIESGNVVINGGTYKVVPTSSKTLHALNIGDDNTTANVTIKGGTFIGPKGTIADSGSAVNVKSGSSVTIEGGSFSGGKLNTIAGNGTIVIKGGEFDQNPKAAYIAEGYKAVEKDGLYYVVADGVEFLTPQNYSSTTIASNTKYHLIGDFANSNVGLVMAKGVENVVFDGEDAKNINELIVIQNGTLIDNANTPIGQRSGNVTVQNFNILSQINVFACKTEVVVQKNTAEALMIYAGNCDVKVLNNTIDANFESHPTYRNETTTWNTNNYGIALNIFDYNLWLDGNTVTNATGHSIGINGWEGTIDNGDENKIESFKNNTITVNSTTKTKRAAFKVWDDETYASNDDDTNVVNATAQAFIDSVLADGSNTFNIIDGYNHTIFSIYNVNTNN